MHIVDILRRREAAIIEEAVRFAKSLPPLASEALDGAVLRDHLPLILKAIAHDLEQPQTRQEEVQKSEGRSPVELAETAAQIHGRMRAESGLSVSQVVAEFRVLRSVVGRMWIDENPRVDRLSAGAMIRFNEAIDQAIAESVDFHSAEVTRWRNIFLAVIGHDLRGPLQSVLMIAERLSSQLQGTPYVEKSQSVIEATKRVGALLHSLLDYSRAQLGQPMPLRRRSVDLAPALEAEISLVKQAHPHIALAHEMQDDLIGEFDDNRLREALSNLLTNAVQYSEPGTPIRVVGKNLGQSVRLEVSNQGDPIAPDSRHTIFDPLRRLDGGRRAATSQNMGIGLFIVREVAHAHGGRADLDCSEGEITFWIEVPKTPVPEATSI